MIYNSYFHHQSIGYKVRHKKLLALAVHYLLKNLNETLTVTKTAGEILFDGYEDNVLKVARALNITVGLPGDKFGWFYGVSNKIYIIVYHNKS